MKSRFKSWIIHFTFHVFWVKTHFRWNWKFRLKSRFLYYSFSFHLKYKLICQKPAHFLFSQMAVLCRFLQMFIVFGMYNFVKKLKEKETTNQRGYLLRKLALNSFGSGWKVIKQKHEFEDLKVTFWDTDIHSLFTSVHILLLTIELESKMSCKKSTIFFQILYILPTSCTV